MFQFDLEYLLEYMLKISDTILSKNPLIKIKNMKQLNKFSKTYGDVSFLLILNENE